MTNNIDQNFTTASEQSLQKITQIETEFKEKTKEYKKTKAKLAQDFKKQLEIILKNFFATSKTIKAISWSQFTPYFMDGEQCVFTVNEVYALSYIPEKIEAYYNETIDEEKFIVSEYYKKNAKKIDPTELANFKHIVKLINTNEVFVEEVWGDHIIIFASKNGFETEEYLDHD